MTMFFRFYIIKLTHYPKTSFIAVALKKHRQVATASRCLAERYARDQSNINAASIMLKPIQQIEIQNRKTYKPERPL